MEGGKPSSMHLQETLHYRYLELVLPSHPTDVLSDDWCDFCFVPFVANRLLLVGVLCCVRPILVHCCGLPLVAVVGDGILDLELFVLLFTSVACFEVAVLSSDFTFGFTDSLSRAVVAEAAFC